MGMYDLVNYKANCKRCGSRLDGFQSKDGECLLEFLNPPEVRRFYTSCDNCDLWHDFKVEVKDYQVVCTTRDLEKEKEDNNDGTADQMISGMFLVLFICFFLGNNILFF